jgi:hypothetical protein
MTSLTHRIVIVVAAAAIIGSGAFIVVKGDISNLLSKAPEARADSLDTSAFLQARGSSLIYKGTPVVLKGTNFDNIGALGAGIGTDNANDIYFYESDYAEVAKQGGNHVRLGISYSWYAKNKTLFFQKMDEQVSFARKHNIWLTFNMFTTPGNCYEGYSNICGFWNNPPEHTQLKDFWVAMANRYRLEPAVAGYDLLNEPTPERDCSQWFPIAKTIRDAVYAVSPHQLVFIATCSDPGNDLKYNNPPRGENIVYEVHEYSPMDMSHDNFSPGSVYPGNADEWFGQCYYQKNVFAGTPYPGDPASCDIADVREHFGLNWAQQNNVPIYIGEWGSTSRLSGYIQYHKDKAELYRDWKVHHAHYTWKHETIKTGGFNQWGIYSQPMNLDDPQKLAAVQISWQGAVRPVFGGTVPTVASTATPVPTLIPATPTRTPSQPAPSRTPSPSPTRLPTATPTRPAGVSPSPTKPVTPTIRINSPTPTTIPGQSGSKSLYRAIDINGSAFVSGNVSYEAGSRAKKVSYRKWFHRDSTVVLNPPVSDAGFASMLRDFVYYAVPDSRLGTRTVVNTVPPGTRSTCTRLRWTTTLRTSIFW